tara:strand:+ start:12305 stop:13249 length:945 start_codon:yes stop_codon:yes gene_type:complete
MDKPEESAVRVTMRASSSEESSAAAEWDVESSGDATTVDPDALSKLRATGALEAVSVADAESVAEASAAEASAAEASKASEFAEAADEFDSAPATVMEDIEQLSPSELLEIVDSGGLGSKASEEFEDDSVTRMDSRIGPALVDPETVASKEECPHCGVLVLPGYPNCPRCKKSLVAAVAREHGAAGGTSLGGRTIPWTIVFIAAVLTAVIVYLAERDEKISEANETGADAVQTSPGAARADDTAADVIEAEGAEADVIEADEALDEAEADEVQGDDAYEADDEAYDVETDEVDGADDVDDETVGDGASDDGVSL